MGIAKPDLIKRTVLYSLIGLIIFIYTLLCLNGLGFSCFYQKYFHVQCLGCGATRAFLSIISLDFESAISYHPIFTLVIYPFLFVVFLQDYIVCILNAIKRKTTKSILDYIFL